MPLKITLKEGEKAYLLGLGTVEVIRSKSGRAQIAFDFRPEVLVLREKLLSEEQRSQHKEQQ